MNFEQELREKVNQVNTVIGRYLPEEKGRQKRLLEAMNYSMLSGGKRLRPLLMRETYEMLGGNSPVIEPFMAAMEMIHTHSLIHDDLPAMDNDDYRRGRKTTHKIYGEAFGILAGDGLLNYAYETASRAFLMEPENPMIGKAIGILAAKTGIGGMIGGQSVDVEMEGRPLDQGQLDFIYRLKTGALIEASLMIGAVLVGASRETVEKLEKIGGMIGLAFQIQDDILDVTGTAQALGKPVHSDEKNHKTTYVTLKGPEQARRDVEELSSRALEELKTLPCRDPFLIKLVAWLVRREY